MLMDKIKQYLVGKKTYVSIVLLVIINLLQFNGIIDLDDTMLDSLNLVLGGSVVGFAKAALDRNKVIEIRE